MAARYPAYLVESYHGLHDIYEAELVVVVRVVVVVVVLVVQVSCSDTGFHIGREVLSMAVIVVGVDHACSTGLPAQVALRGQPNRSGVSKRPPQLHIYCLLYSADVCIGIVVRESEVPKRPSQHLMITYII